MTNEILKAMQGKKEHKARKWWRKNGYKVWRVILFPVWFGSLALEKINKYLNSKQEWNEERAIEILNYFIPRRAEWDEKEQYFYYFNNGMGWSMAFAKKYLKMKDRRFWKVNCYKMRTLLIDKFELEGFTKELGDCSEGWTEISFILNEKKC